MMVVSDASYSHVAGEQKELLGFCHQETSSYILQTLDFTLNLHGQLSRKISLLLGHLG